MKTFSQFLEDDLDEAVKRKVVIRGGKRKIKFKSDRAGYKVDGNKREVKISASDKVKMSLRNKKSARKRKGKVAISNTRRARSMAKRTGT
tara:strand:+ start:2900 stop:3169 length:270 start_codon:yes stop_codon:yes gene_type:complete